MDIDLITIHMPVRRYVYKYCVKVFGDSWRLSIRPKEGKMLYALLERTPERYERYRKDKNIWNVRVPAKLVCQKGGWISQESIDLFNDYIHQLIIEEIIHFHTGIKTRIGLKSIDRVALNQYLAGSKVRVLRVDPKEAEKMFWQKAIIQDILAKYDITEDDLTQDCIVKQLQRNPLAHYCAS